LKQDAMPEKPPNVEGCLNVGLIVIEVFLLLPGFALLFLGLEMNKQYHPHATVTKSQADATFFILICAAIPLGLAILLEVCRRMFLKKRSSTQ
jgi:hypothetical protein